MLISKGLYEMTDKGVTVLINPNLLTTYYVPGIARPWLTETFIKEQNNTFLGHTT